MSKHAVYITSRIGGEAVTFRVGQPVDWNTAQARWERLYPSPMSKGRTRHARRWYPMAFAEVRSVDRHGRGLGSDRHETAIPVPYRAFQRNR